MKNKLKMAMLAAILPGLACATLGNTPATINKDLQALNGNSTIANAQIKNANQATLAHNTQYDIYTFTTTQGITIKQYVANDQVFAVTWHGPRIPNLRQLYGTYFNSYSQAKTPNTGMSNRSVDTLDLNATTYGISGAFVGRAVLKAQLPEGITIENLK